MAALKKVASQSAKGATMFALAEEEKEKATISADGLP